MLLKPTELGRGVALLLAWACSSSTAGGFQLDVKPCGEVHLIANEAPLIDVLRELAQQAHFVLDASSTLSGTVTMDLSAPLPELLRRITRDSNSVWADEMEKDCAHQSARITHVWIVPAATSSDIPRPAEPVGPTAEQMADQAEHNRLQKIKKSREKSEDNKQHASKDDKE